MADEKGPKRYQEVSPQAEEEILSFWVKNKVFEKSLANRKRAKPFVFFEGPPYANGLPGIHHVESRSFKDVVLRYKTMRGFYVPRRAGWDTHGLPTEMAVEKKFGINSKREIEEKIGVSKFVEAAKENVFFYKDAWEKITNRMAYWLDLKNAYVTMANNYIESLWHIFYQISKRDLLYQDYRVLPWCARCGTTLSSHELALGYKSVKEESVYVKFPLKQAGKREEKFTSFLVWTTTPWTLPGNVALAVNPKIDYVTVECEENPSEWLILAEARVGVISGEYRIINRVKGKNLVGTEYESLYPPDKKIQISNFKFQSIAADFVSTEDGSGIVHIAPAFGAEDLAAGKENGLPVLVTADEEGKMVTSGKPWDKKFIKNADPLIIENLKKRSLLFKSEQYEHDYPFCWRCQTPLMYYAKTSWFFKTTAIKKKMLEENSKIDWHPSYLKDGRFGEWLKENVDWAISRERYWGMPLPIWKCEKCSNQKVAGSLKDLDELGPALSTLFVMRHGEALHNTKNIVNPITPEDDRKSTLTKRGEKDVLKVAKKLKKENIEVIVSSPSFRAKETARIIGEELGIEEAVIFPGLYDVNINGFAGETIETFKKSFASFEERFTEKPKGAENLRELRTRVMKAFVEIRQRFPNKNILLVSHGDPTWVMMAALEGLEESGYKTASYLKPGEFRKVKLHNWPYNSVGELDLHKPYIDEVKLKCETRQPGGQKCSGEMKRVTEVADVWFDSGSMPFASAHWPFAQNKKSIRRLVDKNQNAKPPKFYPADYITEGIDQTRGWFYTLLAVSSLLGFKSSYRRVLSLGLVLDEKGEKMSKSKGNGVEPMPLFEKYGADAVRWYFYTINQPWDDKLFREKDVEDARRRFLMILWNSYKYWNTYKNPKSKIQISRPKLVINKWLLARWQNILKEVTSKLDSYDIVTAARKLESFVVEDISHWYIRRIREHMKDERSKDANECSLIFGYVLLELSKTLAPLTPFISDAIYSGVGGKKQSVHLDDWPKSKNVSAGNNKLLKDMEEVRKIVRLALEARAEHGIKIRQPLGKLLVGSKDKIHRDLIDLIRGEVNVKKIEFDKKLKNEVELDVVLTSELKEEGLVREFIRQVQDFRRELKLRPQDKIFLAVHGDMATENILERHKSLIKKEINISDFKLQSTKGLREKEIKLGDNKVAIGLRFTRYVRIRHG